MKKIILSGYMGSGKTTIARLLHAKTGIRMMDLDQVIETVAGLTIPQIFAAKGEIHFRKLEHAALKEILDSEETIILGLGGGTPCYANNHELLKGDGILWIYLKASPQTLYERISASDSARPLLHGKKDDEAAAFIAQHLFERSYFYNQADCKIDTDGKSPDEVASAIKNLLT